MVSPWTSQPRIHSPPPWFRARQEQVHSWRRALRQLGLHFSRLLNSRPTEICRAELGQVTVALREFQQVLNVVRAVDSDASEEAIELRRSVGILLLNEQRLTEALEMLEPLHADMCLVYGPGDEETAEIADALARIRLALSDPDDIPRQQPED